MSVRQDGRGRRRRSERRGRRAEWLAALWLTLKGYSVMARRVRTRAGEIDLIARRGDVIALIEVKARRSHDAASEALTPQGWARMAAAADMWRAGDSALNPYAIRFDAVTIAPWSRPIHHVDAWRSGGV